jgi:hypothetical protein
MMRVNEIPVGGTMRTMDHFSPRIALTVMAIAYFPGRPYLELGVEYRVDMIEFQKKKKKKNRA